MHLELLRLVREYGRELARILSTYLILLRHSECICMLHLGNVPILLHLSVLVARRAIKHGHSVLLRERLFQFYRIASDLERDSLLSLRLR